MNIRYFSKKVLWGLMLVMMLFAFIGGKNVSSVRAQELGTEQALKDIVIQQMQAHSAEGDVNNLLFSPIDYSGTWAFGTVTIPPSQPEGTPALYLFLGQALSSGWDAAVEGSDNFYIWLPDVPADLISANAKELLKRPKNNHPTINDISTFGNNSVQLSFPWTVGETWTLTGGAHSYSGNTSDPWSSLDIAGPSPNSWVRAAREGVVWTSSCPMVRVDHGDSWQTVYYHIANIQVWNGQNVSRGTILGDISYPAGTDPCGGYSTGAHVHFSLMQNGSYQQFAGHDLGGYTVQMGAVEYTGCLVKVSDGSAKCPGDAIYNDGTIGSGFSPPNGVSASDGTYANAINVSWNPANNATSYEIWRNTSNTASGATKITSLSASSYVDHSVTQSVNYYYWIKACYASGCSNFSNSDVGYWGPNGVVIVNPPVLTPSSGTCASYWQPFPGYNGTNAYATLNTNQPAQSSNWAIWQPNLPVAGIYKIEEFVPYHSGDFTACGVSSAYGDTNDAPFTVYHANGTTPVSGNQLPLNNEWLNLGNFTCSAGNGCKVYLSDLNSEAHLSHFISFSAVRFTLISPSVVATPTSIATPTRTYTPIPSKTVTRTVTITPTPTKTFTTTATITNTSTATFTSTASRTATKTPAIATQTFVSVATQDGWVLESSETSQAGGTIDHTTTTFKLGDDATKKQYRSILSFKTSLLPDNAVITGVKLKVQKSAIVGGGNPITDFQGLIVDIKSGIWGTSSLQVTDFQAAADKSYGPFRPALVNNWYVVDLTTAKAYINKLTTSSGLTQLRLRFKLDDNNNAVANYLALYSGNAPAANRPQLMISYYVP